MCVLSTTKTICLAHAGTIRPAPLNIELCSPCVMKTSFCYERDELGKMYFKWRICNQKYIHGVNALPNRF